ncbi:MAG: hypothetical protein IJY27_07175 [Clostridia bacterium]|nr:hypothetical protein [Clostridia bacterium]
MYKIDRRNIYLKRISLCIFSWVLCIVTLVSCAGNLPSGTHTTLTPPADTTPVPNTPLADTTTDTPRETTAAQSSHNTEPQKETPLRILFIGNSLTYYNDMPAILMALGKAVGKDIYTYKVAVGSSTMCQQISKTTEIGSLVNLAFRQDWDYVVIQPSRRITEKENTVKDAELAASKVLDERIKEAGAQTVIYATWGNNTGSCSIFRMNSDGVNATSIAKYTISRADHTAYMKSVSEEFANALEAPMVDCSSLFEFMVTSYPNINMYHTDERHPSLYGSYAVACAFYAHFYNESPVGAAELYHDGIDAATAKLLAQAADHIVRGAEAPVNN